MSPGRHSFDVSVSLTFGMTALERDRSVSLIHRSSNMSEHHSLFEQRFWLALAQCCILFSWLPQPVHVSRSSAVRSAELGGVSPHSTLRYRSVYRSMVHYGHAITVDLPTSSFPFQHSDMKHTDCNLISR